MKATAIAPSNIAFTKYWGKKDEKLRLPENGSISMALDSLLTTTTVEFSEKFKKDQVTINGGGLEKGEAERVIKHLDRIRALAKIDLKAKVASNNNFPTGTGLSSSASGFAALTVAAATAAGLKLSEKELSILARQGSGSACRSIPSGFAEWLNGSTSQTSYAKQIFPKNHWDIADVVAVVNLGRKEVSTTQGQTMATSSPFMKLRLSRMVKKNKDLKNLLAKRDFQKFGELIEAEALELHTIMLTQTPPLIYWLPGTVELMRLAQNWKKEGLLAYFTVNTGQDVHLICRQKDVSKLVKKLKEVKSVRDIIINHPADGAKHSSKHLF